MNPLHVIRLDDRTAKAIAVELSHVLRKPWDKITLSELAAALPEALRNVSSPCTCRGCELHKEVTK